MAVVAPALGEVAGVGEAFAQRAGGDAGAAFQEAAAVAHHVGVLREPDGTAGAAPTGIGGAGCQFAVEAPGDQPLFDLGARYRPDFDAAAATDDGLQQCLRGGRDQAEDRVAGRLLERLQYGVGGIAPEPVGRIDDDQPVAGFERVAGHQVDQAAHLADADVARVGVLRV